MKPIFQDTPKKPQGATSLLVVVAVAALLMVMITGITVVSVQQSRQALNTDLSNRALAAAQSSARDAAQWITENPGAEYPNCDGSKAINSDGSVNGSATNLTQPPINSTSDNKTIITCRTVTISTAKVQQQLKKDDSTQIFTYLPGNNPVNNLKLQWGKGQSSAPNYTAQNLYPQLNGYPGTQPAFIELTLVWWPKVSGSPSVVGSVSADGLPVRTVLVVPNTTPKDFSPLHSANQPVQTGQCGAANTEGYNCLANISLDSIVPNSAGQNIIVRIKPRYVDTDFQAEFFNGSAGTSNPVVVMPSKAVIDVTAQVGDLYRRVVAEKPLGGTGFFDDVLYSNASICKGVQVYQDFSLASNGGCP